MRRAFTLIEVLIVLATIALLAAILLPVLSRVRSLARRTVCTSQLKQIGLGVAMYRQDWEGLPPHLSSAFPGYVNEARLFVCPADRQAGQFAGSDRVEGDKYLPSGVSYDYMPQWAQAQEMGWYGTAPPFGNGKWDDLTPLGGCAWHWATSFDAAKSRDKVSTGGWHLILTLGGSVRKIRAEEPIEAFTPDKYQ